LKKIHYKVWAKYNEQEKDVVHLKWWATKQRFSPTPSNITSFFGSIIPYGKDDPHPK
jgi:hypothetical protein